MKDADVRLTEDVQRLAEGFTSFFSRGAYTVTSGIIFACQSVWEFGLSCEQAAVLLLRKLPSLKLRACRRGGALHLPDGGQAPAGEARPHGLVPLRQVRDLQGQV